MRKGLLTALAMIVAVSALVFSSQAENVSMRGEYVEVRTASVFAGACHYNGEVVTTGRDALMAWNVTSGNGRTLILVAFGRWQLLAPNPISPKRMQPGN